jgi:nitrous oxidase accessory protein NosD
MSVGQSRGVKVYNSEFSYTSGTTPGCGINIESDLDHPGASGMHIENCMFQYNQGNGIQVYRRSVGTTIRSCLIEKNNGYGILTIGANDVWIALNRIRSNQLIGVGVRSQSNNVALAGNRFYNNARRFRSYDMAMLTPAVSRTGNVLPRHTEVANSVDIRINTNLYHDK